MKKLCLAILLIIIAFTAGAYEYKGPEAELVALINKERAANGAPPLSINWEVTRLARYKSEEMKTYQLFHHESLVYGNPAELLGHFHVPHSLAGANIAVGHETPEAVVNAWRSSLGHYTNLISPDFTSVGVGLTHDESGIPYWTLMLIAD